MIDERVCTFTVASEVLDLGIINVCFVMHGLTNREYDSNFEAYKATALQSILPGLSEATLRDNPILQDFRRIHTAIGRSNKRFVASTERLLSVLLNTGTIPRVNLLVDIYNLVSVMTTLSLGAHDIASFSGNIQFRITDSTERFIPMGETEPKPVSAGEYAYIDDSGEVLCRMEVRQGDKTKITTSTEACLFIIQGNAATPLANLYHAADQVIRLASRYCEGTAEYLYTPDGRCVN